MPRLAELLSAASLDMNAIAAHLDGLDPVSRRDEVTSIGKREQARLFESAAGFRPIGLDHFVAPSREPMREVVHRGRNSLPAFKHFAKVFARPDDESVAGAELWGYNRNPSFVETVVGPGYFVARAHERPGEVLIDYLQVPPRHPQGWPDILPNSARLSRFVYYRTQDVMRGVSEHVSIGRATRDGAEMPNWFVLCREE